MSEQQKPQTQEQPVNKPTGSENPQKIAEVVNGFSEIEARQQTIHSWTVTSWRNGEPTAHTVNLHDVSCTCEDMQYNKSNSEVCDHFLVANHYAQRQMDISDALMHDLHRRMDTLERSADKLEQATTAKVADAAAEGNFDPVESDDDGDSDGDTPEQTGGETETTQAAKDAEEKLQQAFDDVIDDMKVEAAGDAVFIQTGFDTPDDWPFPGGDDTFNVITDPETVKYVHDGTAEWADSPHPLYSEKPGEWFKNAIWSDDVDQYINEVLK